MSNITFDAYIFFDGNAREAMEFYKSVFGGDLSVSTFGDMPGSTDENKDKVMHSALTGGVIHLMGSDAMDGRPAGNRISLSLSGDDKEKLTAMFEALSAGGTVRSPLKTEAWGDTFGMLTDTYEVEWMVNISAPKEA